MQRVHGSTPLPNKESKTFGVFASQVIHITWTKSSLKIFASWEKLSVHEAKKSKKRFIITNTVIRPEYDEKNAIRNKLSI